MPRATISLRAPLYLRLMYDRFGYPGLFGAYNAGPGRYAAYLEGRRPLPGETRVYLRKVAGGKAPRPAREVPASVMVAAKPKSPDSETPPSRPTSFSSGADRRRAGKAASDRRVSGP